MTLSELVTVLTGMQDAGHGDRLVVVGNPFDAGAAPLDEVATCLYKADNSYSGELFVPDPGPHDDHAPADALAVTVLLPDG